MADDPRLARAREFYAAGRLREAEELLNQVVAERPGYADAWKGLGLVRRRQGGLAEAVSAYEHALAIEPQDAEALVNLGVAVKAVGQIDRAIAHFERAITLQPRLGAAYFNLGNCFAEQGRLDRAGAAYFECVKINPRDMPAVLAMARVLRDQGRLELAEKTLRTGLKLTPDSAEVGATLGALLHESGRLDEAQAALDDALTIDPKNFTALYTLGNLQRDRGRMTEAVALYRRALEVVPDDPDAAVNLSTTLDNMGDPAAARDVLTRAVAAHPERADVRYSHGLALLSDGELRAGWPDYAFRSRTVDNRATRFAHLPRLEKLDFASRRVVIWGDQGIGDQIIYGGFLQDLRRHADHFICELDARLSSLFARSFPELKFVERTFDPRLPATVSDAEAARVWASAPLDQRFAGLTHQIALPDLGQWLRPDFASFPRHEGYLRADPARVASYRAAWRRSGERLIGVSWRSKNRNIGEFKSIALRDMVERLPRGCRLVNLQYGDVAAEIAASQRDTGRSVEIAADLDHFNDIDGLAALVTACDAVITVSNVTAHLAGSLGRPTALLCPAAQGKLWYWFRERPDSPWYPSLQIFRQGAGGRWSEPLVAASSWIAAGQ